MSGEPAGDERVRTAELIGALCLATDLGMGFPFEHGLHETLIAMRLAERLRVDRDAASQTYYASLLSHAGCTSGAHVSAEVFGGSMTESFNPLMYGSVREVLVGLLRSLPDEDVTGLARATQTARRFPRMARATRPALTASCEVAGMLAEQTGAPPAVPSVLSYLTDRWDGHGPLGRGKREEIPLPMRIVHVATDAALQRHLGGLEHAVGIVRERAGHAFDPEVAAGLVEGSASILALDDGASAWDEVSGRGALAAAGARGRCARPRARRDGPLRGPDLADFAGHSTGVAELASEAAGRCRIDAAGATVIRRAGLVHDLGRVAVHARVWQKPGPLTADELGAGAAAPVPHRTLPVAFAVPGGARPGGRCPPRAARPKRLPPRLAWCRPDDAGAPARRRRRLSRDVRAAPAPPSTSGRSGRRRRSARRQTRAASTRTRSPR